MPSVGDALKRWRVVVEKEVEDKGKRRIDRYERQTSCAFESDAVEWAHSFARYVGGEVVDVYEL